MDKDLQELQRLQEFTKLAKARGFSAEETDAALRQKGSSLADVANLYRMGGVENIAKAREGVKQIKEEQQSFGHRAKQAAQIASDAIKGGAEGALWSVENALSGITGGGYDWLNRKLGGGYDERTKYVESLGENLSLPWKWVPKASEIMSKLGGAIRNPIYGIKAIKAGAPLAAAIKSEAVRNILNLGISGALGGAEQAAFASDFDAESIKKGAKRGGMIGLAVGGLSETAKTLAPKIWGATSKTGENIQKLSEDAGKRKSVAFKQGRKMSPEEILDEAETKISSIKRTATDNLIKGKRAIGHNKVDVVKLTQDLNNSIPKAVEQQPGAQAEFLDKAKAAYNDFMNTKQTVADLDRYRQNIWNIRTGGDAIAKQMKAAMYDAAKKAGDLATKGQYSKVLEPANQAYKALGATDTVSQVEKYLAKDTPEAAINSLNKIFKSLRDPSSVAKIKEVFGQEFLDKLVGNATKLLESGRGSWAILKPAFAGTLGGTVGGPLAGLLTGVGSAVSASPRLTSNIMYDLGRFPLSAQGANAILGKVATSSFKKEKKHEQ